MPRPHGSDDRTNPSHRFTGMAVTVLALLPAMALAVWTRAAWPDAAAFNSTAVEEPGPALLEVLVTEGGCRLRLTDLARDGWQPPMRPSPRTPLDDRWTWVPRGPGLDEAGALVDAARRLTEPHRGIRVQLRGDDQAPWHLVVAAGQALAPLGGQVEAPSLLAGLLVDARP